MSDLGHSGLIEQCIQVLESVLPTERPIGLHEPLIDEQDKAEVNRCMATGWVSSAGKYVDDFEQALCDYTKSPHAIAMVNGTSALHTCLILAGVEAGHEILAPALTFVGTINPISYCQATPHFVDIDPSTLGIDPDKLELHLQLHAEVQDGQCINRDTGRVISTLVVVHVLGIPADMPAIMEVAKRWHLTVIEDAAESLGSWRNDQHTGTFADLAALSFNGNKIITTGGGGAVLCKDQETADKARHLSTTAKKSHAWAFEHDAVGYNYRLPNINAALGCAQLKKLPSYLEQKRQLAEQYTAVFSRIDEVNFHQPPADVSSNHWLNLITLPDEFARDQLLQKAIIDQGIFLRPLWDLMHHLPMYESCPKADLSVSQKLWETGVCLPSSPSLAD